MSKVSPLLDTASPLSLADIDCSDGSVKTPGNLSGGSHGLLVTANPKNAVTIRVSGTDVSATHGQPLAPGGSVTLLRANANLLRLQAESATQPALIHITQV